MEGIAFGKMDLVLHLGVGLLAVIDKSGRAFHEIFNTGGCSQVSKDIILGILIIHMGLKKGTLGDSGHLGLCVLPLHILESAVEAVFKVGYIATYHFYGTLFHREQAQGVFGIFGDYGTLVIERNHKYSAFGIGDAGYDFYEHHWIPLYKTRCLKWYEL